MDYMASGHPLPSNRTKTPIIQITQATPTLLDSSVFKHRTLFTLLKYLQATPFRRNTSPRSGSSTASLTSTSSVPSVPSCDRCSLAQLEHSADCRACERQWFARKIWYQKHERRRRWLTEPFIRPAESNDDVRAVMEFLRGPCSNDPVTLISLASQLQTPGKKEPSSQVVDPSIVTPDMQCSCAACAGRGTFFSGSALRRHLRSSLMEGTGRTQGTIRTWMAVSWAYLTSLSCRGQIPIPCRRSWGPLTTDTLLPSPPYDSFGMSSGHFTRPFFYIIPILWLTILWFG